MHSGNRNRFVLVLVGSTLRRCCRAAPGWTAEGGCPHINRIGHMDQGVITAAPSIKSFLTAIKASFT